MMIMFLGKALALGHKTKNKINAAVADWIIMGVSFLK